MLPVIAACSNCILLKLINIILIAYKVLFNQNKIKYVNHNYNILI